MGEIPLIPHEETDGNRMHDADHRDLPLDPAGRVQAAGLTQVLGRQLILEFHASPMRRARRMAAPLYRTTGRSHPNAARADEGRFRPVAGPTE
jgi:broad specificity phosphatase PhoE